MESVEQGLAARPAGAVKMQAGGAARRKRTAAVFSLLGATLFWAGN